MSENKEIRALNSVAFAIAMLGGPLIVTLCTFWVVLIPVFALIFGGIPYLVIGTPMALWMALTGPVTFGRGAIWGGLTVGAMTCAAVLFTATRPPAGDIAAVLVTGAVCAVFAGLWAGTSAGLYAAMTNPKAI